MPFFSVLVYILCEKYTCGVQGINVGRKLERFSFETDRKKSQTTSVIDFVLCYHSYIINFLYVNVAFLWKLNIEYAVKGNM